MDDSGDENEQQWRGDQSDSRARRDSVIDRSDQVRTCQTFLALSPFPPFAPFPPFPAYPPYPPYPPAAGPCVAADVCSPDGTDGLADHGDDRGQDHGDGSGAGPDGGKDPPGQGNGGGNSGGAGVVFPPSIEVRRPDDLLVVTLRFTGFAFLEDPPRLARTTDDAYMTVEFPPQSFGEEAFLLTGAQQEFQTAGQSVEETTVEPMPVALPVARIRMAATSRVVVAMPAAESSMAFDLPTALAAMRDWPMRLAAGAVPEPQAFAHAFDWLRSILSQGSLTTLRSEATGYLAQLAGSSSDDGEALRRTIAQAGWHMAQQASAVPPVSSPTDPVPVTAALRQSLLDHVDTLAQQYPALRGDAARTASLVALSLSTLDAMGDFPASTLTGTLGQLQALPVFSLLLGPQQPPESVTALEMPYRLVTSPLASARWRHSASPVVRGGRIELWHTRLSADATATGTESPSRIRAIWSPDYRPPSRLNELAIPGSKPIRMSLDPADRAMLVTLMAGFDAKRSDGRAYVPAGSEAKRLHLSSLGGLLDAEGSWDARPEHVDLQRWVHQSTLGRDHYVRVVYAGWLYPFRHPASLVKVTERRFEALGAGGSPRIAVLRQRFFVEVRRPRIDYAAADHTHGGRDFPFTNVEILTRVTPDLTDPGMGSSALAAAPAGADLYQMDDVKPRMLFWPMVSAGNANHMTDVLFDIAATDLSSNRITFSMPLLFVGETVDADVNVSIAVKSAYNQPAASAKRRAVFGGKTVAYAPDTGDDQGGTRLPTANMTFRAGDVVAGAKPRFYPEVDRATVGIKPVQKLLGKPEFMTEVAYPDFYALHGFDATTNAGEVFLQLTSAAPLKFGGNPNDARSDALGALACPQMNVLGLSRLAGPVAGQAVNGINEVRDALGTVARSEFDPKDFFGDATLLGGIKLGEIVEKSMSLAGGAVPKMLSRDFPDRVEASFDWNTTVTGSDGRNLIIPRADPGGPETRLVMNGLVRTPLNPSLATSCQASASLNNFKVNLFGFVILWFENLKFSAQRGQKPDVSVALRRGADAVTFGGPLEFVNRLRALIPGDGFSVGPGVSVTPSGIGASYSLTLPAIEVGVFTLSNATLSASFSLPFDATPARVNFYFSRRERPFSLTVSLLGGGGFLGIGVSAAGVNEIEAALEFGAMVAINLGVASGSVEIKAGIYFHWLEPTPGNGSVELAGYVRIHGELCVLAIISVSLTFNLQLAYLKDHKKPIVYGEAQLTVEIDILMFSTSVSVHCRREFSGGESDPKFIEQIPDEQVWADYCNAFAPEAA